VEVNSAAEVFSIEDGVVQIAFDLSGSEPGYLIISLPEAGGEAEGDFFGHDHYVELKDQLFGRYGGLSGIKIPGEGRLEVHLAFDVPDVGRALTINTHAPMSTAILSELGRLQST
jgi:hypothetical protein